MSGKGGCGLNYFVEGIQGSGKSTMTEKLFREHPEYTVFREGDYCPVELAWCAYVDADEYSRILGRYPSLASEIAQNTVREGDARVICYTCILTDVPGFHKDLEQYEIYNGNRARGDFEELVLARFRSWSGDNQIFECAIFQNVIENQMLFFEMTDEEIIDFYRKVKESLDGKEYEICYLDVDDVRAAEEIIKKERSDEQGNELWFPMMVSYLENAPYARHHGLRGMDGLVTHLERRKALEKRILTEVFAEHASVQYRVIRK